MLNYIFGGIIIACLLVIIFIIVRKVPQLSNIDLINLPEEQQSQKKRALISRQIDERGRMIKEKYLPFVISPIKKLWGIVQLKFRIYVGKIERLWLHEQHTKKIAKQQIEPEVDITKLSNLLTEADQSLSFNNLDRAEELYIAAIKIDQKSAPAYRGLGNTYFSKGAMEEAHQTFQFVLQLEPDDDSVLVKLAEIAENQGDLEEAIDYYQRATVVNDSLSPRFYKLAELLQKVGQNDVALDAILQAVELEPKNPKYLDLLIETAIICNNKEVAAKYYNELRLVNAENQKLDSFRDRIDRM